MASNKEQQDVEKWGKPRALGDSLGLLSYCTCRTRARRAPGSIDFIRTDDCSSASRHATTAAARRRKNDGCRQAPSTYDGGRKATRGYPRD